MDYNDYNFSCLITSIIMLTILSFKYYFNYCYILSIGLYFQFCGEVQNNTGEETFEIDEDGKK